MAGAWILRILGIASDPRGGPYRLAVNSQNPVQPGAGLANLSLLSAAASASLLFIIYQFSISKGLCAIRAGLLIFFGYLFTTNISN